MPQLDSATAAMQGMPQTSNYRDWSQYNKPTVKDYAQTTGEVVSAGLPFVGTLASSAINARNQRIANEQARKWQLEDRAHDEWYNSPAHQRALLESAGFAPAEFSGPVATDSKTVSPVAPQVQDFGGAVMNGLNAFNARQAQENQNAMTQANIDLVNANKEKALAETNRDIETLALDIASKRQALVNSELDATYKGLEIDDRTVVNSFREETLRLNNELARTEIELNRITGEKVSVDIQRGVLEIGKMSFEIEHLLPQQYWINEETIRAMSDKHYLTEKEIEQCDAQTAWILTRTEIISPDALEADYRLNVLKDKGDAFERTLRNNIKTELNKSRWEYLGSTVGGKAFNNAKTALQNAENGMLDLVKMKMLGGIGSSVQINSNGHSVSGTYRPRYSTPINYDTRDVPWF